MIVFPQPQSIAPRPGVAALARNGQLACCLVLAPDAPPLERSAAELVAAAIARCTGARPSTGAQPDGSLPIYCGGAARAYGPPELAEHPEGYTLSIASDAITLAGHDPAGTFYAAQTLVQMLCHDGPDLVVDNALVVDRPDFRYRGLYVESKWGPDLMELEDWKALIDYMAGLKFNSLGIGVYCCWVVQYDGQRTEFVMLPFPGHPELATPKAIRYYSAVAREWRAVSYLPPMVEQDFFGEVVAYAKSRNITVRPHFNGPGHTTLIPCTHPEVAAKDAAGTPQPYGYCLSNPQTYELLFELWDSIIDRYLAPNGVDWFHMGLDEIWLSTGVDEDNPERVVDPWCKCPACSEQTQAELLTQYVIRATQHLVAKGMRNITLWNDHLSRFKLLDADFVRRLEDAGVRQHVVLQWWRYDEPVLEIPPELGLRAWTTPMPGYFAWLFTQSYTSNIYPHLALGHRAGAEGADAYCVFDPAFDRNYTCLAEYAWNQKSSGDLYQFKSRYARKVTGRQGFDAIEPFEKWDQVYDSMPLVSNLLDMLLPYWHTYSRARERYPQSVVRALAHDELRVRAVYRRACTHLRRARSLFAACRDAAPDPALIDQYLFECDRLTAVVELYEALLKAVEQAQPALGAAETVQRQAGLAAAAETLAQGLATFDQMVAFGEQVKPHYLLPQLLRDLSTLRAYAAELAAAMASAGQSQGAAGRLEAMLAQLAVE